MVTVLNYTTASCCGQYTRLLSAELVYDIHLSGHSIRYLFYSRTESSERGGGCLYRVEDLHPQAQSLAASVIRPAIKETHRTFACVHLVVKSDTEISQENTLRSVCGHVVLIKIYVEKSAGKKLLKAQHTRILASVVGCLLADNALSQV
jgi:hypothetical protein